MSTPISRKAGVEDSMNIGVEAITLIQKITKTSLSRRDDSKKLLAFLRGKKFVRLADTFGAFVKRDDEMDYLRKHLAFGLPDKIAESDFGCGLLSPFDLYHSCGTDKQLDECLLYFNVATNHQQLLSLRTSRNALYVFILELRLAMIKDWDLVGTPNGGRIYKYCYNYY